MGVIELESGSERPWEVEARIDESRWQNETEPEVFAVCTEAEEWHLERIGGSVQRYRRMRDKLIAKGFPRLRAGSMAWEAVLEMTKEAQ